MRMVLKLCVLIGEEICEDRRGCGVQRFQEAGVNLPVLLQRLYVRECSHTGKLRHGLAGSWRHLSTAIVEIMRWGRQ